MTSVGSRSPRSDEAGAKSVLPQGDQLVWQSIRQGLVLRPVFQPIVSLATGQVAGYEALSRPTDGDGRELLILDVVECARAGGPEAEAELDLMAIAAIARGARDLPAGAMLFVNVCPGTVLDHPDLAQPLAELPCRLVLEVTERTDIPDSRWPTFTHAVDILRWRGFLVAMDDCGAGYSGLNRLVALRPDFAKVDMELVRGVDQDSAKAQIVASLVTFARRAGIEVIAEGVETLAELQTLAELGVGHVQGFYLGKPQAAFLDPQLPLASPGTVVLPIDPGAALGAAMRLARMAVRGLGDAPGLHEAIVHAAHEATGADAVILHRRAGQALQPLAGIGFVEYPEPIPLSSDTWLVRAFTVERPAARQTRTGAHGVKTYGSAFSAPVVVDGAAWGLLTVGFRAENRIRGDLADLVSGLADQAGLIIAANQGGLLPQRTDAIDTLRYAATHPNDPSDFLARVIRDVERFTGSHDCWIGLVAGDRFDIVGGNGVVDPTDLAEWLDPTSEIGKMPPGVALREARTVVVDDIRLDPSLAPQLAELLQQAIISAAAIPMLYGGQVVGILKVYHSTVAAFSEEQLGFLREVAELLGAFVAGGAVGLGG